MPDRCTSASSITHGARSLVAPKPAVPARNRFLKAIAPYRDGLVVAAECMFAWYWLADLCQRQNIPFVLGHALYMKAIHGGKTKNDKIDAHKIAALLRGGNFPMAYVYPQGCARPATSCAAACFLVRQRAQLVAHMQNTNSQYNLPVFGKKLAYAGNREN